MNNSFDIPDHLFRVKLANSNWSFTPATYVSCFIQEMEKRYGSRDRSWTYVGVEFQAGVSLDIENYCTLRSKIDLNGK